MTERLSTNVCTLGKTLLKEQGQVTEQQETFKIIHLIKDLYPEYRHDCLNHKKPNNSGFFLMERFDHILCLKSNMDTMEYYAAIKKNSFVSVLMRWMKLEPIIQSEVSQKDKDHYSILTHIYGL